MENVSHTYPGREHDNFELFVENWREKESRTNADLKGNRKYLNCNADWESQHQNDFLKEKLFPLIFSKLCRILGKKPEINLFTSRLSNKLSSYSSWKFDPSRLGTKAPQRKWYHRSLYALPPIALIHKVLKKVEEEKVPL